MRSHRLSLILVCCAIACNAMGCGEPAGRASVVVSPFGTLADGTAVDLYTLTNPSGMEVRVVTYGGIVTGIRVPDRNGRLENVVLGYRSLEEYVADQAYRGALIGRYANRIGGAQFALDGRTYPLAANHEGNALHGGVAGFNKKVWRAESFTKPDQVGLVLTHTSQDGDEGYPGTIALRVTYALTDANGLSFDYSATTDKPTVVNLTHHDYFNLAGAGSGDVLGHLLAINADSYTPADAKRVPTGEIASVAGTPFDFRKATPIGARLGGGYDHNFVIHHSGSDLAVAARVEEPKSGRVLEVRTTEPGLQFYVVGTRDAFSLETQHFPDSPNKPAFPSTTLRPGEVFRSRTVYAFSAR